jgi:geranylgeranyl diphosphate synthase, type II
VKEGKRVAVERYLQDCKQQVDAYLEKLYPPDPNFQSLLAAMNYSLLAGGKRLRPSLCMAVADAFGVHHDLSVPVAAALEMMHCYSLIHDDLPCMDDDDLRRGKPTSHKVFGEATALLAGDALLTAAFEQLAKPLPGILAQQQVKMVHLLAVNSGVFGMVGGQAADLAAEGQAGSFESLQFIHIHKTAKLLQASVMLGGILANLNDAKMNALSEYGLQLGLAFQMTDDYLDIVGSTEQLGKSVGADVLMDKLTYPRFIGLEQTKQLAEQAVIEAIQALKAEAIHAPMLVELAYFVINRSS